jgi:dTMP kinase
MNTKHPGTLILLEGGEGAGKTTQCHRLVDWLWMRDIPTTYVSPMRGTPECRALSAPVLDPDLDLDPLAQTICCTAVHRQCHAGIVERLKAGEVVVSDRGFLSTLVYQGVIGGVDLDVITTLNGFATGGRGPDLTLILDCPVRLAQGRRAARGGQSDKYEEMGTDIHDRLRQGFLDLAPAHNAVVIDATRTPDEVEARIRELVDTAVATGIATAGTCLKATGA